MPAVGPSQVHKVNRKNSESYEVDFIIVDGDFMPLLRLKTTRQMKLLTAQSQNILTVSRNTVQKGKATKAY